jgi:hypothetical protein
MERPNVLTRILAVVGTVLVWLPILAPVLFGAFRFVAGRRFLVDYLMPAELFPVVLVGALLLVWAAARARSYRALIGWGFAAAVVLLFGGQGLAVVTGLASGETEPVGLPWALVLASIVLYSMAVIAMGVGGILLLRDLFRTQGLPMQGA